jgi:hypothetical protein
MSTLRQIVIDAFRESGIIGVGDEPDGDEFTEAFRKLQNVIDSLFGAELGENLSTFDFGTSGVVSETDKVSNLVEIPENSRLIFNSAAVSSLHLPAVPNDGARLAVLDNLGNFATYPLTIYGNGRTIESAQTLVCNTNSFTREWFYRDDLGQWVKVTNLLAGDDSPFPKEFDDFLIILLALRINPRYGAETHQETSEYFAGLKRKFRARYRQTRPQDAELGLIRLSSSYYSLQSDFNTGRP